MRMAGSGEISRGVLNYASGASRVQYLLSERGATVVIPAPPGRRIRAAARGTAREVLGEMKLALVVFIGSLVVFALSWPKCRWEFSASACGFAVVAGLLFWLDWSYYRRLDDPILIEVGPDAVRFLNLNAASESHRVPRDRVYDIRYAGHPGKIVVLAAGAEPFECRPVEDEAELRRMAGFLREAVGLATDAGEN